MARQVRNRVRPPGLPASGPFCYHLEIPNSHEARSSIYRLPCGSVIKNLPAMQETCIASRPQVLIPGLGRSLGEGNGNPVQYSCLENPTDRGGWQVTVCGVARVRHYLATRQQQIAIYIVSYIVYLVLCVVV